MSGWYKNRYGEKVTVGGNNYARFEGMVEHDTKMRDLKAIVREAIREEKAYQEKLAKDAEKMAGFRRIISQVIKKNPDYRSLKNNNGSLYFFEDGLIVGVKSHGFEYGRCYNV